MKEKILFFDTEFTGLRKSTTLISIGIIDRDAYEGTYKKGFYAEFTDYDKKQCDDWISTHVINNLALEDKQFGYKEEINDITYFKGSKEMVKQALIEWVNDNYRNKNKAFYDSIQMVSDVCHYDFVLFIDLFGSAFDLPEYIVPYCKDINEDIASNLSISYRMAFDYSREELFEDLLKVNRERIEDFSCRCKLLSKGHQHNSLYDAFQISYIFNLKKFIVKFGLDELELEDSQNG